MFHTSVLCCSCLTSFGTHGLPYILFLSSEVCLLLFFSLKKESVICGSWRSFHTNAWLPSTTEEVGPCRLGALGIWKEFPNASGSGLEGSLCSHGCITAAGVGGLPDTSRPPGPVISGNSTPLATASSGGHNTNNDRIRIV